VNDLLTPLAVVGIVIFVVAVAAVAAFYVRGAIRVVRLLRSGRLRVRATWGTTPVESAPWGELDDERTAPAECAKPTSETPSGWGFDRR
jgi:hypothetical protein